MTKEEARRLREEEIVLVKLNEGWREAKKIGTVHFSVRAKRDSVPMLVTMNETEEKIYDVAFNNIRYLYEKGTIEIEEKEEWEKERIHIRDYMIKELGRREKQYKEEKEKFVESFNTNPSYTMKWRAESVIEAQYKYMITVPMLNAIEEFPLMKLHSILENAIEREKRIQLEWVAGRSTSTWSNATEEAEALARTCWLRDTQRWLYELKKYDI